MASRFEEKGKIIARALCRVDKSGIICYTERENPGKGSSGKDNLMAKNGGGRAFFAVLFGILGIIACITVCVLSYSVVEVVKSADGSAEGAAGAIVGAIVFIPFDLMAAGAYLFFCLFGLPCSISLAKHTYGKRHTLGVIFSILYTVMLVIVLATILFMIVLLGANSESSTQTAWILTRARSF